MMNNICFFEEHSSSSSLLLPLSLFFHLSIFDSHTTMDNMSLIISFLDIVLFFLSSLNITCAFVFQVIGEGRVSSYIEPEVEPGYEPKFVLHRIPAISSNLYLRSNVQISGMDVKDIINTLQEWNFGSSWQPFEGRVPASVNYAWKATSWTLTLGHDCCHGVSTEVPTQKSTSTTEGKCVIYFQAHITRYL